ncbi:MAG: lysylphosphatidylglycerol synthase transmembrane domain-containing protein [Gammaproteobacteria bacterium]
MENHNTKKTVKLLIQIFLTVLAIYLLLSKVSVVDIVIAIQSSNFYYLLLAFIAFNISKIISAVRLNQFFLDIGLKLSQSYNLSLYYLGMFYNLFLPGGIGGDGYKVYLLNKNYHKKVLTLTKALLLDRISGLIALLLFTTFLLLISSFAEISYLIPAGSLLFLVAILPFTIGGIGARELTFLYLLEYIHGDVNAGVTLSVLFFIITAASSFIGIIFIKKL